MPLRKVSPTSSQKAALGNILLVDDNKLGLSARKCVLEELGHTIWTASNGVDALEQFASRKFDLVVTDYKMPRMDGLELIAELRKTSTGSAGDSDIGVRGFAGVERREHGRGCGDSEERE